MAPRPEVQITKYGNPAIGAKQGNEASVLEIVTRVTAQAKSLAPVDEGALRNSIMGRANDNNNIGLNDSGGQPAEGAIQERVKAGQGVVGTAMSYGTYVEFGTRRMAPQPYLRPAIAIEANGRDAREIITRIENEKMRGALKKGQKRETFR